MDARQLEIIKYLVPGLHRDPFSLRVDAGTMVIDIISHFHSQKLGACIGVTYLPKDLALNISPVHDLVSRFTAVACRLEYLKDETKLFSLDLYDKTDKIQLFIQSHPDQPEFVSPGEERDHDDLIRRARDRDWAPSTVSNNVREFKAHQDKHLVHNGRPIHVSGPPITIYEEAFADIVHDLANLSDQPLDDYTLSKTSELSIALLKIYETESLRVAAISQLIEDLLDVKFELNYSPRPPTGGKSDGAALQDGAIYLHLECKNELGIGGIADFQGALTLFKHISGTAYSPIRKSTCCPCVHLAISGPFIAFAGSIVTDIYNFQSFTNPVSPGGETYSTDKIHGIARQFSIIRKGLSKLREKYRRTDYPNTMKRDHSRLLPHPTYMHSPIRDEDGSPINLLFETRYRSITDKDRPSPRRALFHATYNGHAVLVKFSERYNSVAHRALAERGLAPLLHFSARLRGGVHMSVMQFLGQALDAQHEFLGQELPEDVIKRVEDALTVLHEKNLVHGDIRRPNILVTRGTPLESNYAMDVDSWHAYLVDFDQVGEAGKDHYPLLLNMGIPWPPGVCRTGIMETKHDDDMLKKISTSDSHMYSTLTYTSA